MHLYHVSELEERIGALLCHSLTPAELRLRAAAAISKAAELILDRNSEQHQAFLGAGTKIGLAPEMVREALRNYLPLLQESSLRRMQEQELNSSEAFCVLRPRVVFHVLAGNLFLSGLESINHALLVGGKCLVRCSEEDQYFAQAWVEVIHVVDPEVAKAVSICWWPRDQVLLTRTACAAADVVVAFGSDTSVAAVRAETPVNVRFLPHGEKVSFVILNRDALSAAPEELARRLAYDFSVYDQQGCLSPRALFVQNVPAEAWAKFTIALNDEMNVLLDRLPRGDFSLAARSALARERDEALAESAAGGETRVISSPSAPFVIVERPAAMTFKLGCVNRFVDIRRFQDFSEVAAILGPYRRKTACLGVAGNIAHVESILDVLGPVRVCPIGEMQRPPLSWTHDGRMPLRDLVEFTSVEEGPSLLP